MQPEEVPRLQSAWESATLRKEGGYRGESQGPKELRFLSSDYVKVSRDIGLSVQSC